MFFFFTFIFSKPILRYFLLNLLFFLVVPLVFVCYCLPLISYFDVNLQLSVLVLFLICFFYECFVFNWFDSLYVIFSLLLSTNWFYLVSLLIEVLPFFFNCWFAACSRSSWWLANSWFWFLWSTNMQLRKRPNMRMNYHHRVPTPQKLSLCFLSL